MPPLLEALQQRRFENPRQQVVLNVLYSSSWVKGVSHNALKPHGLTWQQFNLMRILRGQCGQPASMRLLQERMLDPQSNASRLVDKLSAKGYVQRDVAEDDRRRVGVVLTGTGATKLEAASADMTAAILQIGGDLTETEMVQLSNLLDRFRG